MLWPRTLDCESLENEATGHAGIVQEPAPLKDLVRGVSGVASHQLIF